MYKCVKLFNLTIYTICYECVSKCINICFYKSCRDRYDVLNIFFFIPNYICTISDCVWYGEFYFDFLIYKCLQCHPILTAPGYVHDVTSVEGIAFDWVGKKVYWADLFRNRIYSINTDLSNKVVIAMVQSPRALALNPCKGYVEENMSIFSPAYILKHLIWNGLFIYTYKTWYDKKRATRKVYLYGESV